MPDPLAPVDCPECDGGRCLLCAGHGTVSASLAALARKTAGERRGLEAENRRLRAERDAILSDARAALATIAHLADAAPGLAKAVKGGPQT